jgi:uncharacterized membrane protein
VRSRNDFPRQARPGRARAGFYIHLAAYLVVNALLVGVNLLATPGRLWFYWPLLGWGIGVLAHALAVFGLPLLRPSRE